LGEIIKSVALTEKGSGQIMLNAADLASAVYQYTLVDDGQVVATKQDPDKILSSYLYGGSMNCQFFFLT
jgi:hypothetical protein